MANGPPTPLDEQLELPSVARALSHLWPFRFVYRLLVRAARVPYLPGALVLLLLASGRVLTDLGRVLDAMHPLGGEGFKVNDLSPVFSAGTPPAKIVAGWNDWYAQTAPSVEGGPTSPTTIAGWWLALDFFVFVPAYALLLGVLSFRAYGRLRSAAADATIWNARIYLRLLGLAFIAVPFIVGVELVENLLQGLLVAGVTSDWVEIPARAASSAKWLLLFLAIVPLVAAWIAIGWQRAKSMSGAPEWVRDLLLYRMLLVAIGIFAFLLMGPRTLSEQSLDVLRRLPDDLGSAPITPLLVLLVAAVLVVCAHWLVYVARRQEAKGPPPSGGGGKVTALAVGGVALLVLALLAGLRFGAGVSVPLGFWFPPGVAAAVAFLSLPVWDVDRRAPARPAGETFIAHGLGAAPLLIFGLAATTAATGDVFYSRDLRAGLLLALGLVFVALAGAFYVWLGHWQVRSDVSPFRAPLPAVVLGLGLVVGVLLEVGAIADPWTSARLTGGAIGITAGFVVLLALVGSGLSWIAERVTVPAFFVVFRFRRIPVITLLIAWFAVASLIDRDGYHAVRTRPTASPLARAGAQVDLDTAWKRWLEHAPTVSESGRRVRPLLLATTAGGGVRAAYWTALVLDCLVNNPAGCKQPGPRVDAGSLFAASGISGGSLGLVEYAARQARPALAGRDWVDERLDDDYLGPTIARMLFVDSPNSFLRTRWWDDRSAILEGAWERSWGEGSHGPLDAGLYQRGLQFPLLLLNGASVTDGCRFEASILRGVTPRDPSDELVTDCRALTQFDGQRPGRQSPAYVPPAARKNWVFAATRELDRSLCDGLDVRLSTAALLSARFPYVTPSGSLGCKTPGKETSYIVDGGYFDTSGVSPVVELWQSLEPLVAQENAKGGPCVVPLLLEIDNHYAEPAGASNGSRPNELFVPLQALTNARDAREANARIAGAIAFSTNPTGGVDVTEAGGTADRIAHIYPRAHPGTEAPLGWTLSRVAADDLRRELTTPIVGEDVAKVRRWFTPGALRCGPAS